MPRDSQQVNIDCEGDLISIDLGIGRAAIALGWMRSPAFYHKISFQHEVLSDMFETGRMIFDLGRLCLSRPMEFIGQCDEICDNILDKLRTQWTHSWQLLVREKTTPESLIKCYRRAASVYRCVLELVKQGLPLPSLDPSDPEEHQRYFSKGCGIPGDIAYLYTCTFESHQLQRLIIALDGLCAYLPKDIARICVLELYPTLYDTPQS